MSMKAFKKVDLKELLSGGDVGDLVFILDELASSGRWTLNYRLVFQERSTTKYYMVMYSRGSTEGQDQRPFEDDGENINCLEVIPVQQMITVYKSVKEE